MRSETGHPVLHQHEVAIKRMAKNHPDKVDRTDTLLNIFDKQAFNNLSSFSSEDGAVIPYTTLHLRYIPDKTTLQKKEPPPRRFLKKKQEKAAFETLPATDKKVVVVFSGFAVPERGHPIYPEIFYNLPFTDMQKAKELGKELDVTYVCMGQATGLGGVASKEANKKAKEEGFKRETKLIAKFAEQFLPEDTEREKAHIVFHGISMGGLKATEACLQSEHPNRSAEIINPPRIPGLENRYQPRIPQIVSGYLAEGLIKKRIPELKEEIIPSEYTQELQKFFEEKGFHTKDSFKQRLRKERAVYLNLRNIFKNKLHKNSGDEFPFPVIVHSAAFDPITASIPGMLRAIKGEHIKNGNVNVDFAMTTHTNNHYPVDEWAQAMENVNVKRIN